MYLRTSHIYIFIILFLSSIPLVAQTLTEKLGGVKTDFDIISSGKPLEVLDQVIIKRGLSNKEAEIGSVNGWGYAYGYGLETYRLEFVTTDELSSSIQGPKKRWVYKLEFRDMDNSIQMIKSVNRDQLAMYQGDGSIVYSVNLQQIPLIVLDNTEAIHIDLVKVN